MIALAVLVAAVLIKGRGHPLEQGRRMLWIALIAGSFASSPLQGPITADVSEVHGAVLMAALGIPTLLVSPTVVRLSHIRHRVTLGCFGALAVASSIWSVSPPQTFLKAAEWCIRFVLLLGLARRYRSEREALLGLWWFSSAVVVSSVFGLLLFPQASMLPAGSTVRLWGVLPRVHPNSLAAIAVVCLILTCRNFAGFGGARLRRLAIPVAVAATLVLLLTRSRLSLVAGLAVLAWVVVQQTRSALRPVALSAMGLASIAAITVVQEQVFRLLARGQTYEQLSTLTGRFNYWAPAWEYAWQRPWFGHGYYAGHRIGLSALLPDYLADVSNLDNMWLENFVNLGLTGVALTAVIALAAVSSTLRMTRASADRAAATTLLSIEVFLLIASFYNPSLNTLGPIGMLFGFVILAQRESVSPEVSRHIPEGVADAGIR